MKCTSVLFAFLLVGGRLSHGTSLIGHPLDGSILLHRCETSVKVMDAYGNGSDDDIRDGLQCSDYVEGYTDALIAAKSICKSHDFPNGKVIRAYVAFMPQHPKFLKKYQGDGLYASLRQSFPCLRK